MKQRFESLTGLRFFAAAAVFVCHLPGYFGEQLRAVISPNLAQAVGLFFVLSGFVLAWRYPALPTPAHVKRFWWARFARIWPLHVTLLVVPAIFVFGTFPRALQDAGPFIANFFLIHAWIPTTRYFLNYNVVAWSVSTEAAFYLLFPLLIYRFEYTWGRKLLLSLAAAAVLVAVATALRPPLLQDLPTTPGLTVEGITRNPLVLLHMFVAGMCAALAYRKIFARIRLSSAVATALQTAALLSMVFNVTIFGGLFGGLVTAMGSAGDIFAGLALYPLIPSLLIILTLTFDNGLPAKFLRWRPIVYLGDISFAIYMTHPTVFPFVRQLMVSLALTPMTAIVIAAVATIAVSALLFHTVETPAKRWILGVKATSLPTAVPSFEESWPPRRYARNAIITVTRRLLPWMRPTHNG